MRERKSYRYQHIFCIHLQEIDWERKYGPSRKVWTMIIIRSLFDYWLWSGVLDYLYFISTVISLLEYSFWSYRGLREWEINDSNTQTFRIGWGELNQITGKLSCIFFLNLALMALNMLLQMFVTFSCSCTNRKC